MSEIRMNLAMELGMKDIYKRGALDGMSYMMEYMRSKLLLAKNADDWLPRIVGVVLKDFEAGACKDMKVSKGTSKASKASKASSKASFLLPFVGVVSETKCYGIKWNSGLHTQCPKETEGVDYCKTCQGQCDENESGKPNYGDIRDRLTCDLLAYVDCKGKRTLPYANYMKKRSLDRETVVAEAAKFGIIIPEEHFVLRKPGKLGRPKKVVVEVSDTDSETKPKKRKPTKTAGVGEDLVAALVNASQASDSETESVTSKASKTSKAQEKAREVALRYLAKVSIAPCSDDIKEMKAQVKALKAAAKLEKDEKARKFVIRQLAKFSVEPCSDDIAEMKAQVKVLKAAAAAKLEKEEKAVDEGESAPIASESAQPDAAAEESKEDQLQVIIHQGKVYAGPGWRGSPEFAASQHSERSMTPMSELSFEDEEDGSISVNKFEHDGVEYYRDADNNYLYNLDDISKPYATFDEDTQTVDVLPA